MWLLQHLGALRGLKLPPRHTTPQRGEGRAGPAPRLACRGWDWNPRCPALAGVVSALTDVVSSLVALGREEMRSKSGQRSVPVDFEPCLSLANVFPLLL